MNIDTNSVLYLFLFILPGAFSKILRRRFAPSHISTEKNKSSLIETAEIVVISSMIFLINNIVIIAYRKTQDLSESFDVFENFSRSDFLMKYILLTLFVTIVFTVLFYFFDKKLITMVVNTWNKFRKKPIESETKTIWENVFESNKHLDFTKGVIMSIEKNGEILSRGWLKEFPAPNTECDEFILCCCADVEEYFLAYANKPSVDKRFSPITDFEYTILSKGITLKFYNIERYQNFVNSKSKKS